MPINETTTRPQRVSSYQARIERTLTDSYHEVPSNGQAGSEWVLEAVGHTNGYATCELCGHSPIRRLFWIRNTSTQDTKMIGSECARNYVRVNLVDAYLRTLTREQNRRRTNARREEQRATYAANRAALEAARSVERATWRESNSNLVSWLRTYDGTNSFVADLRRSLSQYGSLTLNQTVAAQRVMEEVAAARVAAPEATATGPGLSNRTPNAFELAANPDQCPHIYNGTYTMDDGTSHMTFQIYTATRGNLQGKRIVKKQNTYGSFEGFGFVGADGSLVVWRRYREQADRSERFIVWARSLLASLNVRTADRPGVDNIITNEFTIQRTRSCRRCNRQLTVPTSIESGIGPECQRRDHERTTAAAHHEPVASAAVRPHTYGQGGGCQCRACVRYEDQAQVSRGPAAVPQQQLQLSELGTGMVQ